MKLHVINNEKKKLQCVFNTLVIRNEALERSYEGGLVGFLDTHGGECNGKITVVVTATSLMIQRTEKAGKSKCCSRRRVQYGSGKTG